MADLWYAKVDSKGVVYDVFCDDMRTPQAGDIPLDPKWYWGRAPGIRISDPIHGNKYKVENGRLVATYDNSAELTRLRESERVKIIDYKASPIISPKKKARMPAAKQEACDHIDTALNENEIYHTRVCGY